MSHCSYSIQISTMWTFVAAFESVPRIENIHKWTKRPLLLWRTNGTMFDNFLEMTLQTLMVRTNSSKLHHPIDKQFDSPNGFCRKAIIVKFDKRKMILICFCRTTIVCKCRLRQCWIFFFFFFVDMDTDWFRNIVFDNYNNANRE